MTAHRTLAIFITFVMFIFATPFWAFGYSQKHDYSHRYEHNSYYSHYGSGNYYQNGIYYPTVNVPTYEQSHYMRNQHCHHCHDFHPNRYNGYSIVNTGYTSADRFYQYRPYRNAYRLYEW